jgi:hypothetical protein
VDEEAEPVRGLDLLYVAVRSGVAVDPQLAFEIATEDRSYLPPHVDARWVAEAASELAEASLAGDERRLATATAAFLKAVGYEPGFYVAPDRFARLERALDIVRADLRASGLTGEVKLVRLDRYSSNVVVQTWAGDKGWTSGVFASEAADDLTALVAVAEQASQAVMESLDYQFTGAVWPGCTEHGQGASPEARNGSGVWWCAGINGGHVLAEIGSLPESSVITMTGTRADRRPVTGQVRDRLRDNRGGKPGTIVDVNGP